MGISPEYVLHEMTLHEFALISEGYEYRERAEMERVRLLCYNIYNASPNRKKSYKITEFMPLVWDKKPEKKEKKKVERPTREDFMFIKSVVENLQANEGQ